MKLGRARPEISDRGVRNFGSLWAKSSWWSTRDALSRPGEALSTHILLV